MTEWKAQNTKHPHCFLCERDFESMDKLMAHLKSGACPGPKKHEANK